ncbi:hypothetical protein HSB1_32000 [Halogranum salarium B-1]|uniref:Uncharacterized protein n=1 Tax=Halogranum salarium B-1 TaxID=1210908 RepID=J3EVP2_9EURY|nr:hypothetical protein HSB1_32000 [Halogranum salarium B-1]
MGDLYDGNSGSLVSNRTGLGASAAVLDESRHRLDRYGDSLHRTNQV